MVEFEAVEITTIMSKLLIIIMINPYTPLQGQKKSEVSEKSLDSSPKGQFIDPGEISDVMAKETAEQDGFICQHTYIARADEVLISVEWEGKKSDLDSWELIKTAGVFLKMRLTNAYEYVRCRVTLAGKGYVRSPSNQSIALKVPKRKFRLSPLMSH